MCSWNISDPLLTCINSLPQFLQGNFLTHCQNIGHDSVWHLARRHCNNSYILFYLLSLEHISHNIHYFGMCSSFHSSIISSCIHIHKFCHPCFISFELEPLFPGALLYFICWMIVSASQHQISNSVSGQLSDSTFLCLIIPQHFHSNILIFYFNFKLGFNLYLYILSFASEMCFFITLTLLNKVYSL